MRKLSSKIVIEKRKRGVRSKENVKREVERESSDRKWNEITKWENTVRSNDWKKEKL